MMFKQWLENTDAKARFKELQSLLAPLIAKKNLTNTEADLYKKLTDEMHDIMFTLANPLTIDKIPPANVRKSTLSPNVIYRGIAIEVDTCC